MSGIGWKIATEIVVLTTRTVVGVILARLLVPREYGLAAMALMFVGVTSIFTDLSRGTALTARRTITENDRSCSRHLRRRPRGPLVSLLVWRAPELVADIRTLGFRRGR